jgi:type II secretory pathway pseudopilin PulG
VSALPEDVVLRRCEGMILIEVIVAIILLGSLVVPLAGGILSAAGRADGVRQQAARVAGAVLDGDTLRAGMWGSEVARAWWRLGPTLLVRPERSGDVVATVGLWVDGWFLGEESLDGDRALRLDAPTWSPYAGSELVLRVRTRDGAWGPPWRSLVPGADGVVSLPVSTGVATGVGGQVVAHAPAAGNPAFQLSWAQVCPEPGPLGLPLVLQTVLSGPGGISLDGSGQSWSMELKRGLDVYF